MIFVRFFCFVRQKTVNRMIFSRGSVKTESGYPIGMFSANLINFKSFLPLLNPITVKVFTYFFHSFIDSYLNIFKLFSHL